MKRRISRPVESAEPSSSFKTPLVRLKPEATNGLENGAELELVRSPSEQRRLLVGVKLLHTAAWLFLVGCILAIPIAGARGQFRLAAALTGIILVECAVLVLNGWRCPLTDLAARYTDQRTANFDIYLPLWLAQHNKTIFGTLFVVGGLFVLERWLAS